MNAMKISARVLLGLAALMILRNISNAWGELHDWHGVVSTLDPAFFARVIDTMFPALTSFAAGLGMSLPASMQPIYAGPDRRDAPEAPKP